MNVRAGADSRLCSIESSFNDKIIKDIDYNDSIDRLNRIMDFYSMSKLLQPKHLYFADKGACIKETIGFKEPENEKLLLFAKICGMPGERLNRKNPYRKHQLSKSNTSRKIKMLKALIEKYNLTGFRFAFLTLTMPKELSYWLSYQKHGKDIAWRMYHKFWAWYDEYYGGGMAAHVNLHTWRSEVPLEPHFHFHCLIPNYQKKMSDIKDEAGENGYEFKIQEWHRQRGGRYVPVSEKDIKAIKLAWWRIIAKVCNKHKVEWYGLESSEYSQKIDIHYAYANWREIVGKCKLMHWFNYQGRYPLEDYAKYSNKHLDCPNPPEWLENYTNHNRAFGWWKQLKVIAPVKKNENIKIHPVTGRDMEYWGHWSVYELIDQGHIGFLEVIRGKPVFHRLSGKELAWLLSVQRYRHPAIEHDMMYEYQAEYE